jgi:hypothetical protein
MAHPEWSLPVGLSGCPRLLFSRYLAYLNPYPSWEFFTTLDYEWGVIRGRRPYRWTIWVRNQLLALDSSATPEQWTDILAW